MNSVRTGTCAVSFAVSAMMAALASTSTPQGFTDDLGAALARAFIANKDIANAVVAWLESGKFSGEYMRCAKDGATAAFGEWQEVKDGGTGKQVKFSHSGGSVRMIIVYKGGKSSVFVDGEETPVVETDGRSRVLNRIKEGRFRFNGSGARLLSMKVMRP